ncbi:MAG: hypothetical protein GX786_03860 [Clostridiales bacterium]|nr:hypothetical protein [Clostridiales bacterium]
MKQVIIGIDTSCYTTSLAAVDTQGNILANERQLLPVPKGQAGLRQNEAFFIHVKQLPALFEKLAPVLKNTKIAGVCVSVSPTGKENSYMPVFLVGKMAAQALAMGAGASCMYTNHQAGHIEAAKIGTSIQKEMPFLAFHLSGGTTDVLLCNGLDISKKGGSKDLHIGQLVDRTGVALGLGFPSGKELEELAKKEQAQSSIPVSMAKDPLQCHFSGAEAQIMRWIKEGVYSKERIAAEVYSFLSRSIFRLIQNHSKKWQTKQVLLAGGVASSHLVREKIKALVEKRDHSIDVHFACPLLAGDNAVGVAMIGKNNLYKQEK